MLIASVILAEATAKFDKIYDYVVPKDVFAKEGCRVMIPFGRGTNLRQGFILKLKEGDGKKLKKINYCIDKDPLLNSEGLYLVHVLHDTVFCRWFDGVKCQIPPGAGMKISMSIMAKKGMDTDCLNNEEKRIYEYVLKTKNAISEKKLNKILGFKEDNPFIKSLLNKGYISRNQMVKKNILDKKSVMARIIDDKPKKLSKKQKKVFDLLSEIGSASIKELCYYCAVTQSVIKTMDKNSVIELFEEIETPALKEIVQKESKRIILSDEQQKAYEGIKEKLGKYSTNLLFGVTGSGKTSVFLKLIDEVQKMGKEALVLIPEISLTPQTSAKFKEIFGEKVAVLNSTLSMTERMEQFRLIKSGKCPIVVGTRLSVFSPLNNIGLIVIDEEQEHTYHSQMSPRFHARQIAVTRAKYYDAPLLLCSATPSIETFYYAKTGRYGFFKLTERYSKNEIPPIETVDMIVSPMCGDSKLITGRLADEISYNLIHKEQTVLLLNRRGYQTKLCCVSCRQVIKCPNCSVAMTFHSANGRLICHSCGYQSAEPKKCPHCGGEMLRYNGEGTQKAQQELEGLFKEAKILRMDADSTMTKNSHKDGFNAFKDGNYDIMIGTQMVSKGLNFPLVTLVGILNADLSLFSEDFRSFERTFSLITQTVGRAGRGKKPGRALIQTLSPENSVLQFCKTGNYEAFYDEEIKFRKVGLYPPFCNVVSVTFKNATEYNAKNDSVLFVEIIKETAQKNYGNLPLRLLGPAPASTYKRSGSYYMQVLLKCRADKDFCELLKICYDNYIKEKHSSLLTVDMFYD